MDVAPPVVGGFQGGHGKAYLQLGAVRALCRNAPKRTRNRSNGLINGAETAPEGSRPIGKCERGGTARRKIGIVVRSGYPDVADVGGE